MLPLRAKFIRLPLALLLVGVVVVLGYVVFGARAAVVGDINGDGQVNIFDLSILLSKWSTNYAPADLNSDGTVNIFDLSILLSHWGQSAPTPSSTPSPTPTPTPVLAGCVSNGVPAPCMGGASTGATGWGSPTFDDEFDGNSLDATKWSPNWYGEGGSMNGVGTYAANVSVLGGNLILTLASSSSGALVHTDYSAGRYQLSVGGYAEARIDFPGSGTSIDNWPAWWVSGPSWPAAGENDIAEGLGTLTVNYHSPSGSHNQGTIPGTWASAFHTYGVYRKASSTDVYWDGVLVKSYATDDNGGPEELILNVGSGHTASFGAASQIKVDYVRAWH